MGLIKKLKAAAKVSDEIVAASHGICGKQISKGKRCTRPRNHGGRCKG